MPRTKPSGIGFEDDVMIGGSVDDSPIGASTPSTVAATTLSSSGDSNIATASGSKAGFFGASAVVQPASASQTAMNASQTTKTTTQLRSELTNAKVLLAEIRVNLKALGLIKGAA